MLKIFQILNPKTWKAFSQFNQGLRYSLIGNKLEACEAFRSASEMQSKNPVYHAMYGMALVDINNHDLGEKELLCSIELGINKNKIASEVYGFLGYAYQQKAKYDYSLQYYERALTAWRDSTSRITKNMLYRNLAALYRRKGQFDDSINMYKKLIEIEPNDGENHFLLGLVYAESFKENDAHREIKKALDLDPSLKTKYKEVDRILSQN
jgi:tetratricopeptide (TPR) repeat protein